MKSRRNLIFNQVKTCGCITVGVVLMIGLLTGCKPRPSAVATPGPSGYFQTPFQSESEFIVQAIVVPAECWNYLCYSVSFAAPYNPNPNPHINEWHSHNPPPGTDYDLHPRLNHPSLVGRSDVVARFEQLHALAPCDCRIINFLIKHEFNNNPSYDQATNLFQAVLPYSLDAMRTVANSVYAEPEQYKKLMLRAAALDPTCYYDLSDFAQRQDDADTAEQYLDQACDADPDSVRVASHATGRILYCLKKGQTEKARQIADFAGEVYSASGLEAKATFFEQTSNYDAAFEWFSKVEERYDEPGSLLAFCERYKARTHDNRFEPEVKKLVKKLFPDGIKDVSLADFQGPPKDGVLVEQQNNLVLSAGLRAGDVIVALHGIRTATFQQYMYVRSSLTGPELDLIVWQGGGYHEIRATPPNHLFGVDFGDYRPQ